MSSRQVRVLVVDDSAAGRAAIAELLEKETGIEVIGRAMDGSEALRMVHLLKPDLITLDLEMPRMDGFTLLRILRVQRPTPVIVVSSNTHPDASIMALEFGALDFVVKPKRIAGEALAKMGIQLLEKIRAAVGKTLPQPISIENRAPGSATLTAIRILPERLRLVAIGASTGGPVALQQILTSLDRRLGCPVVVAQHMPAQFTRAFAERLDRNVVHDVSEAVDGTLLHSGQVRIAPGGKRTTIALDSGGRLITRVGPPGPRDQYSPSVDALFETASACCGPELMAIVLTGMGADGSRGARAIEESGGTLVTESAETALIDGMPEETRRKCKTARTLRLDQVARMIGRLASSSRT